MKTVVYTTEAAFEALRDEWTALHTQARYNRIFLTWEWQSTWWSVYRPGELRILAVRDEATKLVALAPWFVEQRPKTGRTVRTIGCVAVTDYLEIIVHPDHEEAAFAALAAFMAEHRACYDTIDLCNIPEESPLLSYFPDALAAHGFSVEVKQQEVCPVIELPSNWDDYLQLLDKKQRHELRRKLRRSDGMSSAIDWYIVGPEHDLAQETETFLQLMAAAGEEKAGFLQDPKNSEFFGRLVPLLAEKGWLQLAFLTVGGQYAAGYLDFIYGDEVLVYNSGLNLSVAPELSPGILLLAYLIRHAIEHGFKRFDFLRGNEGYKYRMGGHDTRVFMLIATHAPGSVPT